jgi:hypothetical protein
MASLDSAEAVPTSVRVTIRYKSDGLFRPVSINLYPT